MSGLKKGLQHVRCLKNGKIVTIPVSRVATVREKYLEIEFFSRSGKSQGIMWMVREIEKGLISQGI